MNNPSILSTRGVTKIFGEFTAVDSVDFEMNSKETMGIIGPNGAGKTTFLNLITGYYLPDRGSVYSEGEDITHTPPEKRMAMGIARTFQLVHVFENLSVFDNLALALYRKEEHASFPLRMFVQTLNRRSVKQKVKQNLHLFELDHLQDELVGNLPLGSRKLLELAMAFSTDPKILALDEPFAGLGDHEIDEVVEVIKKHAHDKTMIIVEHKISKLVELVDRIAVMHEGRIICCGDCDETLNDPEVRKCYWKVS